MIVSEEAVLTALSKYVRQWFPGVSASVKIPAFLSYRGLFPTFPRCSSARARCLRLPYQAANSKNEYVGQEWKEVFHDPGQQLTEAISQFLASHQTVVAVSEMSIREQNP